MCTSGMKLPLQFTAACALLPPFWQNLPQLNLHTWWPWRSTPTLVRSTDWITRIHKWCVQACSQQPPTDHCEFTKQSTAQHWKRMSYCHTLPRGWIWRTRYNKDTLKRTHNIMASFTWSLNMDITNSQKPQSGNLWEGLVTWRGRKELPAGLATRPQELELPEWKRLCVT